LRAGASLTQSRGLPSRLLFGSAYMCGRKACTGRPGFGLVPVLARGGALKRSEESHASPKDLEEHGVPAPHPCQLHTHASPATHRSRRNAAYMSHSSVSSRIDSPPPATVPGVPAQPALESGLPIAGKRALASIVALTLRAAASRRYDDFDDARNCRLATSTVTTLTTATTTGREDVKQGARPRLGARETSPRNNSPITPAAPRLHDARLTDVGHRLPSHPMLTLHDCGVQTPRAPPCGGAPATVTLDASRWWSGSKTIRNGEESADKSRTTDLTTCAGSFAAASCSAARWANTFGTSSAPRRPICWPTMYAPTANTVVRTQIVSQARANREVSPRTDRSRAL